MPTTPATHTHMNGLRALAAAAGCVALLCCAPYSAHASQPQPQDAPPQRENTRESAPPPALRALLNEPDPQRARRMLDDMLAETRQLERDLSTALERIEKGDDTKDVLRKLGERRQAAREGMRDRAFERLSERPRLDDARPDPRPDMRPDMRDGHRGPDARRLGDRFMKPGGFARLSSQERDQLREDFRRDLPEVAADLDQLRTTNRDMAESIFARIAPRYFEAREARRLDPELAALRITEIRGTVDVLRKTRAYRDAVKLRADDANRAAAIAQAITNLRDAIARNFDERLAVQKREADALAARLDELRADISSKGQRKDALVDDAVDRMVRGLPPQLDDRGDRDAQPPRDPQRP